MYLPVSTGGPKREQHFLDGVTSVLRVLIHTHALTYKYFYISPSVFVLTKRHFILAPPTLMCNPVDHSRLLLLNLYKTPLQHRKLDSIIFCPFT